VNTSDIVVDPPIVRKVLVCQHRTCTKDGAGAVLRVFQGRQIQNVVQNVVIEACGCLGLCGSGPMVLLLPDNIYYWRITPQKAQKIIETHLIENTPISSMMHPRLHQN
jgi:(2Fe-2S) ferredoxin